MLDIMKNIPNGTALQMFILQSEINLKNTIKDAERYLSYGMTRSKAMEASLLYNKLNRISDFTDLDKKKIDSWIYEV